MNSQWCLCVWFSRWWWKKQTYSKIHSNNSYSELFWSPLSSLVQIPYNMFIAVIRGGLLIYCALINARDVLLLCLDSRFIVFISLFINSLSWLASMFSFFPAWSCSPSLCLFLCCSLWLPWYLPPVPHLSLVLLIPFANINSLDSIVVENMHMQTHLHENK